jgi:hypothetical protein
VDHNRVECYSVVEEGVVELLSTIAAVREATVSGQRQHAARETHSCAVPHSSGSSFLLSREEVLGRVDAYRCLSIDMLGLAYSPIPNETSYCARVVRLCSD